ncbi:MAG TPA: Clp protease N-terminal domain-containing protein [Gemmatimonadaceae bacterium]
MYGYNFDERARWVLEMARREAVRLHHEYVGTEHLLLALVQDEDGIAAAVLQNLNLDLNEIRGVIERVVITGRAYPTAADLPYTSRAKKVLELSIEEASRLKHNYLGTEHLLMGLLLEEKGIAAQVLFDAGLTVDAARAEIARLMGGTGERGPSAAPEFPPHLDALFAAPEFHRLLMENEHVRVLDTLIAPGKTTPLHTHKCPAAHYVMSWSAFVRRNEHGDVLLDTRKSQYSEKAPETLWGMPLAAHTVENVGSTDLHIISVEIKRGSFEAG